MYNYSSKDNKFSLIHGNCVDKLKNLPQKFDMVFADPPYFLSNGGLTIKNGKVTCVDKADWDKSEGNESVDKFNLEWLSAVRAAMKPNATIWVSSTSHNFFSIGQAMVKLGYRILNIVTWHKTNPPPNFSKRFFTHSTELIIWARKEKKVSHFYNYDLMKTFAGGKQMQDYWKMPAIAKWEKSCGKHPTQKPLSLLSRIILASTQKDALVLDPFTGSSTTGIAANIFNRKFVGIDTEFSYLELSIARKKEIEMPGKAIEFISKLNGFPEDPIIFNIF